MLGFQQETNPSSRGEVEIQQRNACEETTAEGSFLVPVPSQSTANRKKRSLPGTPDPDAEVIALSPTTLMATNRFVCEICNKGFQRDQNLQLHRRGHNLPWKLRQRTGTEVRKRVYVCPETSCVHHNPSRALGDLTGIKKHYCRKHGEKKWKCPKCSKRYAVQSDWKAHMKICGTKEYKCECGTIFSRRDSFVTHRAFCEALTEESNRLILQQANLTISTPPSIPTHHLPSIISPPSTTTINPLMPFHIEPNSLLNPTNHTHPFQLGESSTGRSSATALLQMSVQMGSTAASYGITEGTVLYGQPQTMGVEVHAGMGNSSVWGEEGALGGGVATTVDFMGVVAEEKRGRNQRLLMGLHHPYRM